MQHVAVKKAKTAECDSSPSSSHPESSHAYSGPCLLPLLQPVRHCLHPFLSARDAACLMQTSHSVAVSLLADYAFVDHAFRFQTVADIERATAVYARYRMRIVRMFLSKHWTEPLLDSASGRLRLPQSLVALTLGEDSDSRTVVHAGLDGSGSVEDDDEQKDDESCMAEFYRRVRHVGYEKGRQVIAWDVLDYGNSKGAFNQPIPPGALPNGLRFLQFSSDFNQPLQVGSIPDTVEVIQFGAEFNQSLEVGHLPASLAHLVFGFFFDQPLRPDVLPAAHTRPVPPALSSRCCATPSSLSS